MESRNCHRRVLRQGVKYEGRGLGSRAEGLTNWETLDCWPQAALQLYFYFRWEGDKGCKSSWGCDFVLSFLNEGDGTGNCSLRTGEAQATSSATVKRTPFENCLS